MLSQRKIKVYETSITGVDFHMSDTCYYKSASHLKAKVQDPCNYFLSTNWLPMKLGFIMILKTKDKDFKLEYRLVFDIGNEYWLARGNLIRLSNKVVGVFQYSQMNRCYSNYCEKIIL